MSARRESIIWISPGGRVLPSRRGAVGGELVVTGPDGRSTHTLFSVGGRARLSEDPLCVRVIRPPFARWIHPDVRESTPRELRGKR
jgi:hypothetical protein